MIYSKTCKERGRGIFAIKLPDSFLWGHVQYVQANRSRCCRFFETYACCWCCNKYNESLNHLLCPVFSTSTVSDNIATAVVSSLKLALYFRIYSSQTSTQFSERKAAHVVDDQYNGHLATRGSLSSTEKRAIVKPIQTVDAYRYMFEKIRDRADGKQ